MVGATLLLPATTQASWRCAMVRILGTVTKHHQQTGAAVCTHRRRGDSLAQTQRLTGGLLRASATAHTHTAAALAVTGPFFQWPQCMMASPHCPLPHNQAAQSSGHCCSTAGGVMLARLVVTPHLSVPTHHPHLQHRAACDECYHKLPVPRVPRQHTLLESLPAFTAVRVERA